MMMEENRRLNREVKRQRTMIDDLKEENSLLKQDNLLLKQDNSLLKQDNSLLKQHNFVLKGENNVLKRSIVEICTIKENVNEGKTVDDENGIPVPTTNELLVAPPPAAANAQMSAMPRPPAAAANAQPMAKPPAANAQVPPAARRRGRKPCHMCPTCRYVDADYDAVKCDDCGGPLTSKGTLSQGKWLKIIEDCKQGLLQDRRNKKAVKATTNV